MTKEELFAFHQQFCASMTEIVRAKNADYTGTSADPFANFKAVQAVGVDPAHGFLTRMMDKMARLGSFIKNGELKVKDESVFDTCKDLANYAVLLAGYIKSMEAK